MRILYDICKNKTLFEVYTKTDKNICILFLSLIVAKLNNFISKKDFLKNCTKLKCCWIEDYLNVNYSALAAWYNTSTGFFELQFSESFKKDLLTCNEENLENFVNEFWLAFIHENTHRQQFKNIPEKIRLKSQDKYIIYIKNDPFNLEKEQNLNYFN